MVDAPLSMEVHKIILNMAYHEQQVSGISNTQQNAST